MRSIVISALTIISFITSKLLLSLIDDPEGTNLLVTTVVAIIIFVPLYLVYSLISKNR